MSNEKAYQSNGRRKRMFALNWWVFMELQYSFFFSFLLRNDVLFALSAACSFIVYKIPRCLTYCSFLHIDTHCCYFWQFEERYRHHHFYLKCYDVKIHRFNILFKNLLSWVKFVMTSRGWQSDLWTRNYESAHSMMAFQRFCQLWNAYEAGKQVKMNTSIMQRRAFSLAVLPSTLLRGCFQTRSVIGDRNNWWYNTNNAP